MPRTERDVALLAGGALLGAALASLMLRRGSKARPSSRFVLLGDSITQYSFAEGGFGAMIADRYQRRVDVCCRGYSGYNSRWVLELLPNICDRSGGDSVTRLVVVFFGANDSSLPEHNLRQHVPLGEYADNLKAIAAALRRQCESPSTIPHAGDPPHRPSPLSRACSFISLPVCCPPTHPHVPTEWPVDGWMDGWMDE